MPVYSYYYTMMIIFQSLTILCCSLFLALTSKIYFFESTIYQWMLIHTCIVVVEICLMIRFYIYILLYMLRSAHIHTNESIYILLHVYYIISTIIHSILLQHFIYVYIYICYTYITFQCESVCGVKELEWYCPAVLFAATAACNWCTRP